MDYYLNDMETIQYAEYAELKKIGIKETIEKAPNAYGFRERTIICIDGTTWEYIPEDNLYEKTLTEEEKEADRWYAQQAQERQAELDELLFQEQQANRYRLEYGEDT
jgi:hypothetical protein